MLAAPELTDSYVRQNVTLEPGQTVEDEVVCLICKGILFSPVLCDGCESIFCAECIAEQVQRAGACVCGAEFRAKEPHKIIRKILSTYKFRCLSRSRGCAQELAYDAVADHVLNCPYKLVRCANKGCEAEMLKRELPAHEHGCEARIVDCGFCGRKLQARGVEAHQAGCEHRPRGCRGCGASLPAFRLAEHEEGCEDMLELCGECGLQLPRKARPEHTPLKCVSALYDATQAHLTDETNKLKKLIAHLHRRVLEQELFFGIKCAQCAQSACEMSQKNCDCCRKNYCLSCSRRFLKPCLQCQGAVCAGCLAGGDFCAVCAKKKRAVRPEEPPRAAVKAQGEAA